jgi:predicted RND superfamily exporter protein
LFALFRRVSAVLLPLAVVLLSIVSTFGAMALTSTVVGLPTQILPSFLLAVGVGGAVHLLTIFFQRFDAGDSREDALSGALEHSGLAIVMTGLTTAGALVSFVTADVEPVAALGWTAPFGIFLGLIYCLALLPPLIAVIPLRPRPRALAQRESVLTRSLLWVGDQSVSRPWTVVGCMSAVLAVSIVGITRLEFRYDPLSWFPEADPLRVGTEFIDTRMQGSFSLEFLVDTGRENGLHDPELLKGLEELATRTMEVVGEDGLRAGKTTSLADVVQEIHQALNENRPDAHLIPDDPRLIAQELLLFENSGSDDLEDVVDSRFEIARFSIMLPYSPPFSFLGFIDTVEAAFHEVLGDEVRVVPTGVVTLFARGLRAMMSSMIRSYVIALLIITPLMYLLLGSLRGGTAAMVPNIAPILVTLGLMGWTGIPLDVFTLLIGSIAIGLAVDDTIHFMHNFRKRYELHADARRAVRETLQTTGRALLTTSVVLCLAFFSYAFASLENLALFGILTGFTIVVAFVADIGVSPALMELATRRNWMGLQDGRRGSTSAPEARCGQLAE